MLNAQHQMDVIAHNLANASTNGFKKQGVAFNESLSRLMADSSGSGRIIGKLGGSPTAQVAYTDFGSGTISQTGNPLDVSIQGEGMFALKTEQGVRYTRDGAFGLNAEGMLVTKTGDLVLGIDDNPIGPINGAPTIGKDGTVSIDGTSIGQIAVYQGDFTHIGHNCYTCNNATLDDAIMVDPGTIEASNVIAVDEMIAMIQTNRVFEMAQRSVLGQEEMTQKLIQSLEGR